jgi:prevent-host-death family protein
MAGRRTKADRAVRDRNSAASFARTQGSSDLRSAEEGAYNVQNSRPEMTMAITASDVIPLTQARASLSDLADQVKAGAEKIITKNGESYVALIDARRLDYYHRLERERIHLILLDEVERGLADVEAGRSREARTALRDLQRAATRVHGSGKKVR